MLPDLSAGSSCPRLQVVLEPQGKGWGRGTSTWSQLRKLWESEGKEGRPGTREDGAGTKQTLNHRQPRSSRVVWEHLLSHLLSAEPPPAVTPGQGWKCSSLSSLQNCGESRLACRIPVLTSYRSASVQDAQLPQPRCELGRTHRSHPGDAAQAGALLKAPPSVMPPPGPVVVGLGLFAGRERRISPGADEGSCLGWCQPCWGASLPAGWEHSGEGEEDGIQPLLSSSVSHSLGLLAVLKAR